MNKEPYSHGYDIKYQQILLHLHVRLLFDIYHIKDLSKSSKDLFRIFERPLPFWTVDRS